MKQLARPDGDSNEMGGVGIHIHVHGSAEVETRRRAWLLAVSRWTREEEEQRDKHEQDQCSAATHSSRALETVVGNPAGASRVGNKRLLVATVRHAFGLCFRSRPRYGD